MNEAAKQPRGTQFQKGNPGKAPGTRNKITLAIEAMCDGEAGKITKKVIELAKDGDLVAAKMVLDRVAPIRKGRPVLLDLGSVGDAAGIAAALGRVTQATGAGEITPEEALGLATLLEFTRRGVETKELADRLAALEAKAPNVSLD